MEDAANVGYKEAYSKIVDVLENIRKIKEFVEGELVVILETIADTEYKAAHAALANVKLAKRPRDQVLLAVGHLQSAHIASHEIYTPKGWRDNFTLAMRMSAVQKDLFTLSLMAICYRYMGETGLMGHTLEQALEAMKYWKTVDYDKSYTLGELMNGERRGELMKDLKAGIGTWFNPASWGKVTEFAEHKVPLVTEPELLRLCTKLKYKPAGG